MAGRGSGKGATATFSLLTIMLSEDAGGAARIFLLRVNRKSNIT